MPTDNSTEYINTVDYKKLERKIKDLVSTMGELAEKNTTARNLRYVEVDIEGERARGKLDPDELYIPQHIIDTNIRREQSSYVQYITQSARAVVLQNIDAPSVDTTEMEKDLTNKLRFSGWQLSMFANIDGMQQNGYGVMELALDQTQPGGLAHEYVAYGDFGFPVDSKDLQESEFIVRNYYFSKTRLLAMCSDKTWEFSEEQVNKVIGMEPNADDGQVSSNKDKSLYRIQKVMFRIGGIVQVAWSCDKGSDDWLRMPRPLYIGRRRLKQQPSILDTIKAKLTRRPPSEDVYETSYPYFVYPYLISENSTISQLKGRSFLDQDCQQAVTSLISSFVTAHRRAAGLYFSKDVDDPNDDLLLQKNIFFKSGALINKKVTQFQLQAPSSDVMGAVNALVTGNQAETSQVNFAANNRKDSRKTAKEISTAENQEQKLTTVQVVLFSLSTKALYETMFNIIQSRVAVGMLIVAPQLTQQYAARYSIKPSGDIDVIERQQLVTAMMAAWPVVQNTPIATSFLQDLLSKMFPEYSAKYIQIFNQAQQAQQSQQAQMQQGIMQKVMQMTKSIVGLSKRSEYFSDIGKIHALPAIENAAEEIEQAMSQIGGQQK